MWRRSQEAWSWCLTWLCFPVWSTRYINFKLHELCLLSSTSTSWLLWYLLCARFSQRWIPWASRWLWFCWWGLGLRSMSSILIATLLRLRKLLWWLRITSTASTIMATSTHWTGSRKSRSEPRWVRRSRVCVVKEMNVFSCFLTLRYRYWTTWQYAHQRITQYERLNWDVNVYLCVMETQHLIKAPNTKVRLNIKLFRCLCKANTGTKSTKEKSTFQLCSIF